jgi:predicted thioesterase
MNAADSVGSQRNIDIAGATPTSCRLLATPVMIVIMENAALNAIRPFLDAGESAVGTAVDVQHFAATPVGHEVRATAEVINVEGKRVDFKCRQATA